MIRLVPEKEVIKKWDEVFQSAIYLALNASTGAHKTIGYHTNALKKIFKKLSNPFNSSMQLWVSEGDDNDINYVVLTQLQVCEFTGRQSLLWFSTTRVRDVDLGSMVQAYQEGEKVLIKYAKDNNCEGISGYTDLEYFKDRVNQDWPDAVTRYFFYLPIK